MHFEQSVARERVECFGEEANLVGIVAEPSTPRQLPKILILNAGVLHRVGPHRLHVRLARRLAQLGHAVIRLDLSGIGDSRALPSQMTFRQSSVADIRTTLDGLAGGEPGTDFILFGICSGADNALAAAEVDPRITGLVLVDPPAYASRRSRLRQLFGQGGSAWLELPVRGLAWLFRRLGLGRERSSGADANHVATGGREMPPIEAHRKQLHILVDREVKILAIYSGALGARYNRPDQLFEHFPELRGKLECAYFPMANHTFTELSAQSELESRMVRWCIEGQEPLPAGKS